MIEITENDKEYFLRIPLTQIERVKPIKGYYLDEKRLCYVFPKRKEVLQALIAEFGDDPDCHIDLALSQARQSLIDQAMEFETLKGTVEKLERELAALSMGEESFFAFKERLKLISDNEPEFCELVDKGKSFLEIVVALHNRLEKRLTSLLGEQNWSVRTLSTLITSAKQKGLITLEMSHIAKNMSIYRNTVVHTNESDAKRDAKIRLFLYNAALLWPMLPAIER